MNLRTLASLGRSMTSIVGGALMRGQLFWPACELFEPPDGILCEYDVHVPMSDGTHLTANVFRPKSAGANEVPVVMCAHPYDNSLLPALNRTPLGGPPQQYRLINQSGGAPRFSTLTSWESPDPAFWVPHEYAVVNLNLPGFGSSGGTPTMFSDDQGRAYYEAIEWVAGRPWCNGSVGLSGVSFLAISQYYVAACRVYGGPPPSLKCISPWEGVSDPFRDVMCPGGFAEEGFADFWWATEVKPVLKDRVDDFVEAEGGRTVVDLLAQHPLYDEYWAAKRPDLETIELPMLLCASFSDQSLHTTGSFRVFERTKSKHKWLYTHRTGKWVAYYSDEVMQLTKDFMDCFLKHEGRSPFMDTPRVRLEVRSTRDEVHEVRSEQAWPIPRTRYESLYLDASCAALTREPSDSASETSHAAHRGQSSFSFRFDEDTELTGYMKLALWVEARPSRLTATAIDDLALFVAVNKRDVRGRSVRFCGSIGADNDMVTRGCLRASWRQLDEEESSPFQPVVAAKEIQPLKPGDIVRVDIALCPSSTHFARGESLELIVAGDEIVPTPPFRKSVPRVRGRAVIHTGGDRPSHLLVPVIRATGSA